jgi:uncharacterized DUF497 family protein
VLGVGVMYDDIIYLGKYIWNRHKARDNIRKHTIIFEEAVKVFEDIIAVTEYDEINSTYEDRYNITGYVEGLSLITVSFMERDSMIRIFSARGADPAEEEDYADYARCYLGKR